MQWREIRKSGCRGFTLVELVVVLATLVILVGTLLPAFAGTRVRTQMTVCMENNRQLALGWRLIAEDNNGGIVSPTPFNLSTWRLRKIDIPSYGFSYPPATTIHEAAIKYDQLTYSVAALYPYAKDLKALHCPADPRLLQTNGAVYISYSGISTAQEAMLQPSQRFIWTEENDSRVNTVNGWPLGENLGSWAFFDGSSWWDAPAVFHITSGVFSYADGHVAVHRWQDDATLRLAAYSGTSPNKPSLALQVTASASPTDGPLNTDGLGSPHDLPFMQHGYGW